MCSVSEPHQILSVCDTAVIIRAAHIKHAAHTVSHVDRHKQQCCDIKTLNTSCEELNNLMVENTYIYIFLAKYYVILNCSATEVTIPCCILIYVSDILGLFALISILLIY